MSRLVDLLVLGVVLFPVLLGAAFVRHGLRERREAEAFATRAARVQAVVVGLAERPVQGNDMVAWLFHPVLRFPVDGQQVEVESPVGAHPPPARAGQTVEVLYDPADVGTARLAAPTGPQLTPDVLVAVGAGLGLAGLLAALLLLTM